MTYYSKCRNCAIEPSTCEKRAKLKAAIKGLGVTSIKFNCDQRRPLFNAGDRVKFNWSFWDESVLDEYGEFEGFVLSFNGTVASENEARGRFIVRIDQDAVASGARAGRLYHPKDVFRNGGFVIKVKPSDMALIDEPRREICCDCLGYGSSERCISSEYVNPGPDAICKKSGVSNDPV